MTDGVRGSGPIHPDDKKMYEQEYKQGANLFQKALRQYQKSDNTFQQAEFKDVMHRALGVMNDSAQGLIRKDLEAKNQQIQKDFDTFQQFPEDPDTIKQLNKDLDDARHSLGG
ncbi:MAG: hypothetical protein A3D96_06835 [Chlamydiae bacterium RIFCSPHIGHO2_12_FULL_44_59]|nr:MAG: hypothetical protein A2796_01980 [Chlamydiae bacterium RIFCSPHIGHO2_01_FULL_44_39]OGN58441.1 MAG: hypothetical protein A3C42_00605 [Chlamydiae bacterium RIFCSPHIGHO2_02_FULL_45_9]OGN59793.1 MAG: hypothetical protein A3D96_06835 [Chlamydiae bacterium RIFCSPHIGHO2_12_FULL_44_59]OGN65891.1 MAG: hypothetical protein A2978_05790 [Chlamydiae bacterium RIFCSPLOWO2_01_FULL_44_52]OGN68301.1 MAG: hypothetical protein A3I67_01910 [Chlamydiae bacterium RIFCSPLOWO2_02_FULL_45_22]OGN69611.1 MAG: hyp